MEPTIDDSINEPRTGDEPVNGQPVRVLTANDIFAVEDIKIVPVDVPEWGGMVYVKAMTGLQREKYIQSMRQIIGKGNDATVAVILEHGSGKLAALTICDAKGNLLFDRSPETIKKLGQKSARALERVVDASAKLNGLDDEKDQKSKAKKDSADQTASDSALNID